MHLLLFLPVLEKMAADKIEITKQNILNSPLLLMGRSSGLEMFYSPHNEYINYDAPVVIAGITPGWQQMRAALIQFLHSYNQGKTLHQVLKETKEAASFIGSMRINLVKMLQSCGLFDVLHISANSLFSEHRHLLHTTSIVKYPLFRSGKNYTGYQPVLQRVPALHTYLNEVFPNEMEAIHTTKLIIPLGKVVDQEIQRLMKEKQITNAYCLSGFPHPSGANGHRQRIFSRNKGMYKSVIQEWAQMRSD
ncbi:hypothetical protein RWE15_08265 [Virgibacillus halophilus]|uniref:Uracil DNA glycosylase superfamily protein n=1 Tax=Tigheibacillus halophilus TaxID=361280 RepID=A0ABU5C5H0_9BACI|nr:hypothetical protein [Virgibacillus halophilus]